VAGSQPFDCDRRIEVQIWFLGVFVRFDFVKSDYRGITAGRGSPAPPTENLRFDLLNHNLNSLGMKRRVRAKLVHQLPKQVKDLAGDAEEMGEERRPVHALQTVERYEQGEELMAEHEKEPVTIDAVAVESHHGAALEEINRLKADVVITRHVAVATGAGFIPLPVVDAAAIVGVQVTMLYYLCDIYGVKFSKEAARSVVLSLVGSSIPAAETRSMFFASGLKMIPIVGTLASFMAAPFLAGASTYAVGKVFVQHLASGGTLLTFNAQKMKRHFEEAMERGKKMMPGKQQAQPATA